MSIVYTSLHFVQHGTSDFFWLIFGLALDCVKQGDKERVTPQP